MKKQAGFSLLEVLIALGIMSGVVAGVSALINQSGEDTRAAIAAQHIKTVGDAANAYIKDNYSAVTANATATTPALIRVSDLVAGGYLQTGFSAANAYQQNTCVLVLEPSANNLTALVVAEGGIALDDLSLGGLAGLVGAPGGGIYSTATTTLRGTMGGWSMAVGNYANANHLGQKCDGSAGNVTLAAGHPVMALWYANGDSTSAFLYRSSVPGRPELNRMSTDVDMNGYSVNNAGTIGLTSVVALNAACTTNGVVARDANGAVMSCQNLKWKNQGSAYWQDPVANYAALPTCNAASLGQTRVATTPSVGSGPRAYTCNGASWSALGVDDSGNFTVAGTATVAGDANVSGAVTAAGRVQGGTLRASTQVTEGAACSTNGDIARDANGLILSCQSGVWRGPTSAASGSICGISFDNWTPGGWVSGTGYCQGISTRTSCPSGYTWIWAGNGTTYHQYWCYKN